MDHRAELIEKLGYTFDEAQEIFTLSYSVRGMHLAAALERGEFPTPLQYRNAKRIHAAFSDPFNEFSFGIVRDIPGGVSLRLTVNGRDDVRREAGPWVFVIWPDGHCHVEYPVPPPSTGVPWTGEFEERVMLGRVDVS